MFGHTIVTMNSLAIFCAGIALALIFAFGLWLVGVGGRFHARRRALRATTTYPDAYPDGSPRRAEMPTEPVGRHGRLP